MRDTGLFEREHAPDLSRKLSAGATKVNLAVSEGMSGLHIHGFACTRAAELPRAGQGHFGGRASWAPMLAEVSAPQEDVARTGPHRSASLPAPGAEFQSPTEARRNVSDSAMPRMRDACPTNYQQDDQSVKCSSLL
jgi:hypothetical protein